MNPPKGLLTLIFYLCDRWLAAPRPANTCRHKPTTVLNLELNAEDMLHGRPRRALPFASSLYETEHLADSKCTGSWLILCLCCVQA